MVTDLINSMSFMMKKLVDRLYEARTVYFTGEYVVIIISQSAAELYFIRISNNFLSLFAYVSMVYTDLLLDYDIIL